MCSIRFVLFAAFLFALCPIHPADAQPETIRWTPELSMQYDQIADTEISPDGEHVAYVVREAVMDETTSEFRQHIHVAAADGDSDVQFTYGEHSNFSPKWSPSGDRLAFLSTRGEGPPQVYLMRTDGGEAYAVTDAETGVQAFQWDPEGERIAYTTTDPKSEAEKQREREKRDVHRVNEEFRYAHLYVAEVKPTGDTTRSVQRLTDGDFHVTGFDWAPGGSAIAFAHVPTPGANSFPKSDLSTVPADSGAVETLVEQPGMDTSPRWSPNGRRVAFLSMGGEADLVERLYAYTVSAEGGTPTALPTTPNQWISELVGWTAGGESLLVADVAGTSRHIYALPTEGGSAVRVTSEPGVYDAASYSREADRLAGAYQNSTAPPEVFVGPRQNVAGLSNLISVEGTTDAPIFLRAYMGGAFWEQQETFEASSPLYHVEGVETPTQILHGAEDERVPPSQGREFYRALREQDVPTEMVLYPRTPHFPREPKLIMDMTPRMLDWFDEHLGRGSGPQAVN